MKDATETRDELRQAVPDQASASIHYQGAREVRVPLPIVLACFVAIAAAIFAMRHLLGE
jgi:hypothetical protein